jgi:hypothetical protein
MNAPIPPVQTPVITPMLMPPDAVPERQGVMTVMSQARRDGDWVLPRLFRALTVMGQVVIDLTQVRIAPGTSEIEVRAIMAEVKIIVPHNLRVECSGHPILGEFTLKRQSKSIPIPDAPLVRITGASIMSSVSIRVIDPNAPSWIRRLRGRVSKSADE